MYVVNTSNYAYGGSQWSTVAIAEALDKNGINTSIIWALCDEHAIYSPISETFLLKQKKRNSIKFCIESVISLRSMDKISANPSAIFICLNLRMALIVLLAFPLRPRIVLAERIHPKSDLIEGNSCAFSFNNVFRNLLALAGARLVCQTYDAQNWYLRNTLFHRDSASVIPNFLRSYSLTTSPAARQISMNNSKVVSILCVGRLCYQKGFDYAIKILSAARKTYDELSLTIIGSGRLKEELISLANDLGCLASLTFLEIKPNSPIDWSSYDIYLHTARYEGMPNALIEAMYCGLPVVAFNCPAGPAEIICNEVNGYLVSQGSISEAADRILTLVNSSKLRSEIGMSAKISIKKMFLYSLISDKWLDLVCSFA